MSKETPALFGKTKLLEGQIDEFLDKVAEGAIYFELGITAYIKAERASEACEEKLSQIITLKERCQDLRRSIINVLYSEMLIPDFRADVLRLLTDLFSLLDAMGNNFQELMIEQGQNYQNEGNISTTEREITKNSFLELVKVVAQSVQTVIVAARTFFRDPKIVRDHIYQVRVYESEADKISIRLKKRIFNTNLKFSEKINLRDRVDAIDAIANKAEDVADELDIYAIQRTL
ncbi:phosphate transport regulator related to PhoU [Xenococcus sp. PCC 7305]|uniref:DUF47 domain-containing protein n=1 Tax=Xenococcus sp. PCC 7305 TaxID=102125 RepID=UPI0002ACAA84|nr:DUF47 family protein [Xenococcus sp. PCC 7305]ELS03645.1 phosphate transport regulator related to PhoU [Xenococcus sp. PCC 7305]